MKRKNFLYFFQLLLNFYGIVGLVFLFVSHDGFYFFNFSVQWVIFYFSIFVIWKREGLNGNGLERFLGLEETGIGLKKILIFGVGLGCIYLILETLVLSPFSKYKIDFQLSLFMTGIFCWSTLEGFLNVFLTPVCEEVFMRGFIYGYILKQMRPIYKIFLQAILFAFFHAPFVFQTNLPYKAFLGFFIFAVLAALIYEKTKSLYPSIAFHLIFNYWHLFFRHVASLK